MLFCVALRCVLLRCVLLSFVALCCVLLCFVAFYCLLLRCVVFCCVSEPTEETIFLLPSRCVQNATCSFIDSDISSLKI